MDQFSYLKQIRFFKLKKIEIYEIIFLYHLIFNIFII